MKQLIVLFVVLINFIGFSQDTKRCEGSEPNYINRMPGFYVSDCKNSDYNDVEFVYYVKGDAFKINKSGKYYDIYYSKKEDVSQKYSSAQINENYYNAVVKIKGKALADRKTTLFASINGKDVYIQVTLLPILQIQEVIGLKL